MLKAPQPIPSANWSLKRLAAYTTSVLGVIQHAGRRMATQTYRVGRALYYAKKKVLNWDAWLREHGIPKMTAWEAIKLYEAVKSEEELEGLTATEAKIRYGIYPELEEKEKGDGSGGTRPLPTEPEKLLYLIHRRLKGAAEAIELFVESLSGAKWGASVLYLPEADEVLQYCREVANSIQQERKKTKRPKVDAKEEKRILDQLGL